MCGAWCDTWNGSAGTVRWLRWIGIVLLWALLAAALTFLGAVLVALEAHAPGVLW